MREREWTLSTSLFSTGPSHKLKKWRQLFFDVRLSIDRPTILLSFYSPCCMDGVTIGGKDDFDSNGSETKKKYAQIFEITYDCSSE